MAKLQFPAPHDVKTIPGTEGWERMYPYQYAITRDDPERKAYEQEMFWFYDGLHYPEPMYPFDIIWDEAWYLALSQYNTRIFCVPPVYGVDHRIINGHIYISPVPVKDPKEIEQRAVHFMERAGYYYKNWGSIVAKWETKMKAMIGTLEALKIDPLPELEDKRVVEESIGESKGYHLLKAYDDLIDLGIHAYQYHFECLNLSYAAYVTFIDFCQKQFPDIPVQRVTQMTSGVETIMYQPDEELKKLGKRAVELSVDAILSSSPDFTQVADRLRETVAGRTWLAELEKARYPWFNVSTGTGLYHHQRSWNDDLNVPLASICIYADKTRKGQSVARPVEQIRKERDRIASEYRALLPSDEARAAFDQLLGTTRLVFPYCENHMFYIEHWFQSVFWNKVREFGAIMKDHGFLNDVEDIWYLKRSEIKEALWDLVTAWATGVKPRGPKVWPAEIAWRKSVLEKFAQWAPPPALGTPPDVIQEPFTVVLWGITNQSLNAWSKLANTENMGDIKQFTGFAASPGTVEGRARVLRTSEEIRNLQEGEILVAPTTAPTWAPAFVKIKAAVTDVGGVMCHAAIVCREYGIPAVVGTGGATSILKTGMMIRVNGSTGEVTVLEDVSSEANAAR
jgi:pyruvate, water dikinase